MTENGRIFAIFVLVTSAIVLATVLLAQDWGGLAPCELCLYERWPWDAAILVSFVAAIAGGRAVLPWVAALLALVFLTGSGLALYHVGVEQRWFAGPSACTAVTAPTTLEALKTQLMHQQPIRCDEPAWTLAGVSLAGWNLLGSLAMTGACLVVFARGQAGLCGARTRRTA